MPTRQLDILALEPFYGGIRRSMLAAMIRCSRHRWRLLKLPPRRLERRLSTAAKWFAEQILRNADEWGVDRFDLLFCSEAMNLADLFRFVPGLAARPSVVYFHDNQLPDPAARDGAGRTLDLANLNSAVAATQTWFNSQYHLDTFAARVAGIVRKHPELAGRDPAQALAAKAHVVRPAVDLGLVHQVVDGQPVARDPNALLVDLRDLPGGEIQAFRNALLKVTTGTPAPAGGRRAGAAAAPTALRVIAVGTRALAGEAVPPGIAATVLGDRDEIGQLRAGHEASVYVSVRRGATCDELMIRSLEAGCVPVVPGAGVYPEIIPGPWHDTSLHDGTAAALADRIHEALTGAAPFKFAHDPAQTWDPMAAAIRQFDGVRICRAIDERFEKLAAGFGRVRA